MRGPGVQPSLIASQSHIVELARSTDIAHARKPCHQSLTRIPHAQDRRKRLKISHAGIVARGITQHATDQVCVRIDETRQESHVAKIDYLRVCRNTHRARRSYGRDRVVRDDHDGVIDRRSASSVNEPRRFQHDHAFADGRFRCNACLRHD